MNAVLLIGNGFDIGIGLNTRYSDFIEWYLKQDAPKNPILDKFRECIKHDESNWADAELAFGQLPFSEFDNDVVEVSQTCLDDFQYSMCAYLREQYERFDRRAITNKIRGRFRKTIFDLLKVSRTKKCREYDLFNFPAAHLNITPINFNYTLTFDDLLGFDERGYFNRLQKNPCEIQNVTFNQCIHAHGSLTNQCEVLFGVDDYTQIKDEKMAVLSKDRGYLQKPKMATVCREEKYKKASQCLEQADIVFLFGLSYGETDKNWWNLILERFFQRKLYIVFCTYTLTPLQRMTPLARMRLKQDVFSTFLSRSNYANNNWLDDDLNDRVEVIDYGPHTDPDGNEHYCDPLHLAWYGKKLIRN